MLKTKKSLILKGNQPQLLNNPEIWVVESGSLALFAVTLKAGVPSGVRHYLLSVSPKAAVFGITPTLGEQLGVLAVAIEETTLQVIPQEDLALVEAEAIILIEGWVRQLGNALSAAMAGVTSNITIEDFGAALEKSPQRYLEMDSGTKSHFAPHKDTIAWVQLQRGRASFMGFEELILSPESGLLPLSAGMWLEPVGNVDLSTVNTSSLHSSCVLQGIAQLHELCLHLFDSLVQREAIAEQQRFQERERINRQATATALGELVSVLQPQADEFLQEGTDLLIAAGAVGRALGITIRPPAKSENLDRVKNPLEAIARASQLRLRRVMLSDRWWQKDCGPLLAYSGEDNQPVALLPSPAGRYEIFDPKSRTHTAVDSRSADPLATVAYMFYRPLPDKALKAWDLLRFALSGRAKDLITVLLTGVAVSLLGMLTPLATGFLIDTAIPDANRGILWQIGLVLLAAALGSATFKFVQGYASLRLQTFSDNFTQAAVWDRLLNLKVSFFRSYSTGDLKSRVSAINQIRSKLSGSVLQTLFTSFFSLLTLGLLFYFSWPLALVAVAVAGVTIAVTTVLGIAILRQFRPLLELEGEIFGLMVQLINGVSKLRLAAAEERAFAAWAKKYRQQLKLTLKSQVIEDSLKVFNTVMPTVTAVLLFWVAAQMRLQGQPGTGFSTGSFLAFYVAFGIFIGGATDLSNTVTEVLEIVTLWKRAKPILEAQPELDLSKTDPGRLSGRVSLDHVTFRYREDGPLNLDDVCLYAEPGEFVALVGPSGSGKSTLLRLLLGFETPETGAVKYDGQDLAGLDISAVRRQLGVVLQNGRINTASIFQNISGGAQVTIDEAWEAASLAGFADDVSAMPMGMHTVISEGGTNLSGGQRQRLLIARALILKPRILLFDEATSALDNRTQAIVSASLEQLQVTRVVIAHRLSTIRHADRIYVVEAGRVVQQGSFEELAQGGLFVQLMARQMA